MIKPLGESALLIELGDEIDLVLNQKIHALDALLNAKPMRGFIESVPAYCSLTIHYDAMMMSFSEAKGWVEENLSLLKDAENRMPRKIEVPVQYGGESGIDLESISRSKNISRDEVIKIHSGREYVVYMMGFTPGFPYMGKLDERLVLPRFETPRTRVPAGTVAIAGEQTGIYPIASPGGWHLIGSTPLKLFDLQSETPFLFAPGDVVRFIPIR